MDQGKNRTWLGFVLALLAVIACGQGDGGSAIAESLAQAPITFTGSLSSTGTSWVTHAFSTSAPATIDVTLDWDNPAADFNVFLEDGNGNVLAYSNGSNKPEHVTYKAAAAGNFIVGIKDKTASGNYTATIVVSPEYVDHLFSGAASPTNSWQTFTFAANATDQITVTLDWDNTAADLNVFLYAPNGTLVAYDNSKTTKPEIASATANATGTWKVALKCASGSASFTLDVRVTPATTPPPPPPPTVKIGAATYQTWSTFVSQVGQPAVSRLYSTGLPTSWTAYKQSAGDPSGVLETVISVKPPNGVPAYSATSKDGTDFGSLIASLPKDGRAWRVALYHEPEDNAGSGEFTPAQWRAMSIAAGKQVHALNRADVKFAIIFQTFTFLKAGATHNPPRNPTDWWEAGMATAVDYVYFDAYPNLNSGSTEFNTLDGHIASSEAWARSHAKPFGYAELAINDKSGDASAKPAMLQALIAREQAATDCDNVIYFDVKGVHYNADASYLLQSDTGSGPAWAAGMAASF